MNKTDIATEPFEDMNVKEEDREGCIVPNGTEEEKPVVDAKVSKKSRLKDKRVSPYGKTTAYTRTDLDNDKELETTVSILPILPSNIVSEYNKSISLMAKTYPDQEDFKNVYTVDELGVIGYNIFSGTRTTLRDALYDNTEKINNVTYGDKNLNIRSASMTNLPAGELKGSVAIANFLTLAGIGEVTEIPLYHSGIWITLRPPTEAELVNLELTVADQLMALGRKTNTLIYSNESSVYIRIMTNFIIDHIVNHTVKGVTNEMLPKYIVLADLYPIIAGLMAAIHPGGLDITISCKNTTVLDENAKPKCTYVLKTKIDAKKIVWTKHSALEGQTLDHMCKRMPGSVSTDAVLEYQKNLNSIKSSMFTLTTANGKEFKITTTAPTLENYLISSEKWINTVSKKIEESLVLSSSDEVKSRKIDDIISTLLMTVYAPYIAKIETKDNFITGKDEIVAILEALTKDDSVYKDFIINITKFITESTISMVGLPAYTCPKCQEKNGPATGTDFDSIIPLNVLEHFLDLREYTIQKYRKREIY